jgi:aromatic ring-cleaving dioxygenase
MTNRKDIFSISIISIIALCLTHPTIHDDFPRNPECYKDKPAKPYSWHLHIVFDLKNRDKADKLKKDFSDFLEVDLERSDNKYICTSVAFLKNQPLCFYQTVYSPDENTPWMNPQWAILFLPKDFERIVTWGLQHKDDLDMVIHPNTGCEIEDNSWWVIYSGNRRDFDLSFFDPSREKPIIRDLNVVTTEEALQSNEVSDMLKTFLRTHDH